MLSHRRILLIINSILVFVVVLLFYLIISRIVNKPVETIQSNENVNSSKLNNPINENNERLGGDLSYIIIISDYESTIKLLDENGKEVGYTYVKDPISDPVSKKTSGPSLQALEYAKPESGKYRIVIGGKNNNAVDIYLYDVGTGEKLESIKGVDDGDEILINFDKDNANNSSINK